MDEMAQFRGMVRRGPWVGSDLNDVFASKAGVDTEPSGVAQDLLLTPSQASRVQTGIGNHNFRDAPPDTTANINDVTNKLPDWDFTQASGTAITAKWVADSASGAGGVLRFDVAAGAAGDHSYIEQIVSVPSTQAQTWNVWGVANFRNRSASRSFVIWGEAQALKSDETTTGTPTAFSTAWSSATYNEEQITIPQASGVLPADAQFIRFRLGVKRDAALTSDTGTIDLTECRLLMAQAYGVFPDQSPGATYSKPAVITQRGGVLYIHSNMDPTKIATPGASAGVYPFIQFEAPNLSPVMPANITNFRTLRGALGTNGWAHQAYPLGLGPTSVSTTTNVLSAQYDAMLVPIPITSPMKVRRVVIRQATGDGTQRNFSIYLACQPWNDESDLKIIASFSKGNYTASAISNEVVNVDGATGYVIIEPGMYWLCIQNAHATRSHQTRMVGGGDWSPNTASTSTTAGDLSSADTIDASQFATKLSNIPMIRLEGDVLFEGAAF